MNSNKQQGFTLIELVMVIVILGILAATALPRFANLQVNARIAALNAALGAVNSAIPIVHSAALVTGQTGATGSVTLEGNTTVSLVFGYPDASATGIGAAVNLSAADFTGTMVGASPGTSYTIDKVGAATLATCRITYTPATSALTVGSAVITSTAGCN